MKQWGVFGGIVLSMMAMVMLSPTISHTQGTGRVTDVVVLYGFEEGAGTTVADVSSVWTPMNLTITTQIRKEIHDNPDFATTIQRIRHYIIKHAT